MEKASYLNIGCGAKFHPDWVNVDKVSRSKHVQSCDVLQGLPFADDRFEVIYHSHVLEHLPKDRAPAFVAECLRVLKPGGVMRVVVPDLENIAREYLKQLEANLAEPGEQAAANYDWIMLELFDQTVRDRTGGEMGKFMRQPEMVNEDYVIDRIGFVARNVRKQHLAARPVRQARRNKLKSLFTSEAKSLGEFRRGGEVHLWMYDRYSLSRLLGEAGFVNMAVKTPFESSIPAWERYELDVKEGAVYDPTSLFMEANKPG